MAQSVTRRAALQKFGLGLAGHGALAWFGLANKTHATGINAVGEVVGRNIAAPGVNNGFLLSAGNFTTLDISGAELSRPVGINDRGEIGYR